MRKRATYLEYVENRRRHSEKAILVAFVRNGIAADDTRRALVDLALLVLILIVLLLGG